MRKDQVQREAQTWRSDRSERAPNMCDVTGRSEEQMQNREVCDRQRADYLRLHDDDEAELDLPR